MSSKLNQDVCDELNAIESLGYSIPNNAYDLALTDLSEYDNMTVSEVADLLITLSL